MRLTLLFVFFCSTLFSGEPISFSVIKSGYTLSTYYEFVSGEAYLGRIIKSSIRVRTCYDLYDSKGDYEGEGICRALSVGSLYAWAREIDLYDHGGEKIGMIDGKILTLGRARFDLYNSQNRHLCSAYFNNDGTLFTLFDTSEAERNLGYLIGGQELDVTLFDSNTLDLRILKFFSAFIADHWEKF